MEHGCVLKHSTSVSKGKISKLETPLIVSVQEIPRRASLKLPHLKICVKKCNYLKCSDTLLNTITQMNNLQLITKWYN